MVVLSKTQAIKDLKRIIKSDESKYYLQKAKYNDDIRIKKPLILTYQRTNNGTFPVTAQLSQNGKTFQIFKTGMNYREYLYSIALTELKESRVKKVKETLATKQESKSKDVKEPVKKTRTTTRRRRTKTENS